MRVGPVRGALRASASEVLGGMEDADVRLVEIFKQHFWAPCKAPKIYRALKKAVKYVLLEGLYKGALQGALREVLLKYFPQQYC